MLRYDGGVQKDDVDVLVETWARQRPDIDLTRFEACARLVRAGNLAGRAIDRAGVPFGLDRGLFTVLAALRRAGPPYCLTPSELSRSTIVTSGAVTKRVDRLEAAGLVARSTDPSDRRGVLVTLTPAGLEAVDVAASAYFAVSHGIMGALTPDERETLALLLRKLLAGFEAEAVEAEADARSGAGRQAYS